MDTLSARTERILWAIIDDYVETAVPVGSRTISKKYETNFSSATIRNEMSDLEEQGYLEQPHVSAGRIPSVKAYRLFVDTMLNRTELERDAEAREYFSQHVHQMEDVMKSAAHVLSEITHYTSLVMMPRQKELRIHCLQLVPMPRGSALLVIVTDTGAIQDTVIHVNTSLDGDALYAISRKMTEVLAGKSLQEVLNMLGAFAQNANLMDASVVQGIVSLTAQMARQSNSDNVMVGGTHNILNFPEYSDVEKARMFLTSMEERGKLLELMMPRGSHYSVRIGPEMGLPDLEQCSLVSASYKVGAGYEGAIGVIGPTRMPYMRILSALRTVGDCLTEMLSD